MTSAHASTSRLDKELVSRGLVESRARAQVLIEEGGVLVNGVVATKSGALVKDGDDISLSKPDIEWASRAGTKLEHALLHWHIDPKGKTVLDIGASTGGFTDVLLSRGATKVYALDVGHGQLVERLRNDARVVNMEKTHINDVAPSDLPDPINMTVIDVSFISLSKVLPKVKELMVNGVLIALVKPQFEVGRERIGKGVVTDPDLHEEVLSRILDVAISLGFVVDGTIASPILGGDGNKEFLLCAHLSSYIASNHNKY